MLCFSRIVRQQLKRLGFGLLICLPLPATLPARENGHPVKVSVFGLFRPERVDITTPRNAIVSIQSGSIEVKQVLGRGQRLQVESRGEGLEIKVFEHDGRLSLAHKADALRIEETVCTLSVAGRIQRDFSGRLEVVVRRSRICVSRALGWNLIRSNRYSIELHSDSAKIRGHGSGHNFGLCQAGAIELSRQGKSMSEILSFYFPGSRIE